jgi:hypothetical protein
VQHDTRTAKFDSEPKRRRGLALLFALAFPALALSATRRAEAQREPGLSIETGSPDALCPELESTRAAVRRRLGELIVPGGSSGYRARYTIGHAPVGSPRDFVRLELFGPEGNLQLERDLPLESESCSTMAEVIALVLDRYFRALLAREPAAGEVRAEPPSGQPELPPVAPEEVPLTAEATPAAAPATVSVSEPRATPTPSEHGLRLVAFELAWRSPAAPALGARALFEAWPRVYVGGALHVGLLSESEALPAGGEVSSRDATLRAHLGWGPQLGSVRTYVGPALCFGLERATSDLEESNVGVRALWAAGLEAGALWLTDEGWSFGATAALDVSIAKLGGRFYVQDQEVLEPPSVRAWLGMAVGHDF